MREPDARYLNRADTYQTEVGTLPIDWSAIALSRLLTAKQLGGNYKNGTAETAWPLIKMGNLGRGRIDCGKVEYIHTSAQPSARDCLQAGDVLFNTRNTLDLVGKVAIWRNELPEAYFNSNIMRMCFDPERVGSNAYMNYVLNTSRSVSALRAIATGTTSVAAIYSRDFSNVFLPLPNSKTEQQSIAKTLGDADALIDSLEQLLTKKRQIKQGAMQELLTGKRRLPGFDRPWKASKLRQLGTFLKGSGIRRDEALSGDLPCVRYGEIYTTHSDHIRNFSSWISPEVASTSTLLRRGDLLFAGSGETKEEIGKCVAFLHNEPAYAGGDIVILRPTVETDSMFLGYLLNKPSVMCQKASRGQGDAVVHISANALGEIEIEVPEAIEQAAIAQALSDMDTEIATLESRLTKARALKQAMAQALLTGRIRLVEKVPS